MLAYIDKTGRFLFDLLYPPRCVNCQKTNEWLCPECLSNISFITPPVCQRCGIPTYGSPHCVACKNNPAKYIGGIRSASFYEDNPIRPAIHCLKYGNHRAAVSALGRMLVDTYCVYQLEADVIVPVPLHASRLKERGYNQSELLAREVAAFLDLPLDTKTLQRVRNTKSQVELGTRERRQNVVDAFACGSDRLAGQRVLLIDDVCTTGSTLDACAAALKDRGVASVWGLTLARAR